MGFEAINPTAPLREPPVTMRVASAPIGTRRRRYIFITARPDMLECGLPWWEAGKTVNIEVGTGSDEGTLRITPGGNHPLIGAARCKRVAFVKFEAFRWLQAAGVRRTEVSFDYRENEWLEITLPAWARKPPGRASNQLVRAMQKASDMRSEKR